MDARLLVKPQRGKSYRSLKSSSPIMLKLRAFNIWKGRSSHLHPVNRKKHPLSYHGKEEGSFMHPLHHCCLLKLSSKSWPLWLTRENSPPLSSAIFPDIMPTMAGIPTPAPPLRGVLSLPFFHVWFELERGHARLVRGDRGTSDILQEPDITL